jgi:hypothetical protein
VYVLEGGEFEEQDRNNLRVFKSDAGKGWSEGRTAHRMSEKTKACWFGHTLHWNCPVTHFHGKVEGMGS